MEKLKWLISWFNNSDQVDAVLVWVRRKARKALKNPN